MKGRLARLAREEGGFTLAEVMVTAMMMVVVLFGLYSIFDASIRVFSYGNDKVEAVENARVGLGRMERELRAAFPYDKGNPASPDTHLFDAMGPTEVTFANDLGAGDRVIDEATEEITYSVSGTTLQRAVGAGSPQPVAEHVTGLTIEYLKLNANRTDLVAATGDPDVEVVRVTLVVTKDGVKQTLTTDVDLRSRG